MWKQDHSHTRKSSWSEKLYFYHGQGECEQREGKEEEPEIQLIAALNCSSHSSFAEPQNG